MLFVSESIENWYGGVFEVAESIFRLREKFNIFRLTFAQSIFDKKPVQTKLLIQNGS